MPAPRWRGPGRGRTGAGVLGVTAWAVSLRQAREAAYAAVEGIRFEGAQYRRDIAVKALKSH